MRVRGLPVVGMCVLLVSGTVHGESREDRARAIYTEGAKVFDAGRFDVALDQFKRAYLLEPSPALLFNMGACLERLDRPHDAADELRSYLRAQPAAANRSDVESRIRGLEEAQPLIDADRLKNAPPTLLAVTPPPPRWPRKRILAVVLGTVAGMVVGVGLGVGLQPRYPESTLHTQVVTP